MIQTFNYVNSNSSTRPQTMIQVSSAASSVCGYYFKDKGDNGQIRDLSSNVFEILGFFSVSP